MEAAVTGGAAGATEQCLMRTSLESSGQLPKSKEVSGRTLLNPLD